MAEAAERRRARRQAKILSNSDDRMKRILGQADDTAVQTSENHGLFDVPMSTDSQAPVHQRRESPLSPEAPIINSCSSAEEKSSVTSVRPSQSLAEPSTESIIENISKSPNYERFGTLIWLSLGCIFRVFLKNLIEHPMIWLMSFSLGWITFLFRVQPGPPKSPSYVKMALTLCGVKPESIDRLESVRRCFTLWLQSLAVFTFALVLTDAALEI